MVARLIGIVDSYDAMTSNRVYRKRLQTDVVLQELEKGRGTQFDPAMVEVFIDLLKEGNLQKNIPEKDMVMPVFNSNKIYGGVTREEVGLENQMDYLTGLLGLERGEEEIAECLRSGSGCIMIIDLDHFRQINEQFGHLAGDYVLKLTADILKDVSENDIICRMGGDAFLLYFAGINSQEKATEKAEDIVARFNTRKEAEDMMHDVTLSIGISLFGIDGGDLEELVRKADKALYHAKQSPEDVPYLFYQSTDVAKTLEQSKIDLDRLVDVVENMDSYEGAFQVDYQEFYHVYDFIQHFSKRSNQELQLILFTLYSADGSDIRVEQMEFAMQCMEQAIIKSLRGVDIGTRYSSTQFLVVLLGTGRKDIHIVTERIVQNYFKLYGKRDITLSYNVADLKQDEQQNIQQG